MVLGGSLWPFRQPLRNHFVQWLLDLAIEDYELWLIIGDFNFYRAEENRNRHGGNFNDMIVFNNVISHLGLIELPLKVKAFTWSNMQNDPLLEQLDWFFTSVNWTTSFLNTLV